MIDPKQQASIDTLVLDTPLGAVIARLEDEHVTGLHFASPEDIRNQPQLQPLAAHKALAKHLQRELDWYFKGQLKDFTVPVMLVGTEFQKRAWAVLMDIPYGETVSYKGQATFMGQPTSCRAVANANRLNPIAILVPCHRVIGSNGRLTGYAYGLERKRALLSLEQAL